MKKHLIGDAKRYFKPVQVTSGAQYTYTAYYKSNVPTQLVAQYANGSGAVSYVLLKAVPLSTTWKQISVTFTVPKNVKSMTILHIIKRNGYLATDNFSLTGKDATPPAIPLSISISSPVSGATVSGTIVLASQVSGSAIQSVQYKLDGNNIGSGVTVAPYSLSRNTTGVASGQHILTAVVKNASGTTVTSTPVSIVVNNTSTPPPPPPVIPLAITITSPVSGAVIAGSAVLSSQVSGSAIQGVQYKLNGNNIGAKVTVPPYSLNWSSTGVADGKYTLTAVLSNMSGATVTSAPVSITVTNTPPPPPPVLPNLIANPGFETPASGDSTRPDQWFTTKIGNNDASFTYLNT